MNDQPYKDWMQCRAFKTDGITTIGYVYGSPAVWQGNYSQLQEGMPFAHCPSGVVWHEFQSTKDGWEEIPIVDELPF